MPGLASVPKANPGRSRVHLKRQMRAFWLLLFASGCASIAEGRIDGNVPPSPAAQIREETRSPPPSSLDPKLLEQLGKGGTVALAQLIDFALRTSPATRATWADARAAAAAVGSKRSAYFPELDLSGGWATLHTAFTPTNTIAYKDWNAGVQLSWLVLDFGGRGADIDEARALLAAANLNHDAAVQDLVLLVEQAYAQYQGARALLVAQKASVEEATTALKSAEERRQQGLATVADVLQARTAYSQAQLNLQTAAAHVAILRGAVATAVGVPANVPVEAEELPRGGIEQHLPPTEDLIAP